MNTNEKLEGIRQWMKTEGIDALVIPSDDPHKSEYVAEYWQARKWVTGFTGSAGTAVITKDKAILWTDFRYYIQAEKQIAGSEFELFKMGKPKVPAFQDWLKDNLGPGSVIGMDAGVFSRSDFKKYTELFAKKEIRIEPNIPVIDQLWTDRPQMPNTSAFDLPVAYAGKSRVEKIEETRKKMAEYDAGYHLISTLDDIAWTLNLRGKDVHTNPVNIAFALIGPDSVSLFVSKEKISKELAAQLKADGVQIQAYAEVFQTLSRIGSGRSILIDPDQISQRLYQSINSDCTIIEKQTPAVMLKAVKNETEIGHIRDTAVKDGVAVVKFLHWLETQTSGKQISEVSVARTLYGFRQEQEHFIDNSFDPIMAYEDHSAMCHYSATDQTDVPIDQTGMFLTDSGGNYLTGTTDITRTVHRSAPSRQQIIDYTLVLKGHISVATVTFPEGTKGFQIDTLARQFLWQAGMNFGHGTGHGVGFFLCVHEGPARISPIADSVALKKGMLLTNEPGVYREGQYGIRLENMILVEDAFENEFGGFLKFENVTFCHFERDLIDPSLLSDREIQWLNTYHQKVYDKLSEFLDKPVAQWLREKTQPL